MRFKKPLKVRAVRLRPGWDIDETPGPSYGLPAIGRIGTRVQAEVPHRSPKAGSPKQAASLQQSEGDYKAEGAAVLYLCQDERGDSLKRRDSRHQWAADCTVEFVEREQKNEQRDRTYEVFLALSKLHSGPKQKRRWWTIDTTLAQVMTELRIAQLRGTLATEKNLKSNGALRKKISRGVKHWLSEIGGDEPQHYTELDLYISVRSKRKVTLPSIYGGSPATKG